MTPISWKVSIFIVAIFVSSVHGQNSTDCSVQIQVPSASQSSGGLDEVVVRIDQIYDSLTNGVKYGPIKTHIADISLRPNGEVSERILTDTKGNRQTLGVAFNGSHVCASLIHQREGEACADVGCAVNEPDRDCGQICFQANEYGEKSTLDLFTTIKVSSDIGNWREHDEVNLYTIEQVQRQCFEQNEYFSKPPSAPPSNLPKVACSVGQRCRVTAAFIQRASNARYYVGCENNEQHLDGCEWEGCRSNVREPIPGSTAHYTFYKVCRYCCNGELCNDVNKCTGGSCDLSMDDVNDGSSRTVPLGVMISLVMILASCSLLVTQEDALFNI